MMAFASAKMGPQQRRKRQPMYGAAFTNEMVGSAPNVRDPQHLTDTQISLTPLPIYHTASSRRMVPWSSRRIASIQMKTWI